MIQFVLASHNKKKLREMQDILAELGIDVEALPEHAPEPEETGLTFAENAYIKAQAACALTGKPALADDSGLCVDALDGAPGIYSARYCEGSDADRVAFLLQNISEVPQGERGARFVSAIACVLPDGRSCAVSGECMGEITREPHGSGGFGYDPVFFVQEYNCTFGELPQDIKNQISHRARAMEKLKEEIKTIYQK